jgi:hypothetical protein
LHVWPHAMPAGLEVTVPRPSPCGTTASACICVR